MPYQYVSTPCLNQHLTRDFPRVSALSVLAHILSPQLHHPLFTEQSGREVDMHMGWTKDHVYLFTNAFQALAGKLL
ncbi:hypothetical protein VAWG001_38670 [Aeromonas dhakensis]|nr:hypothetical protein VAWG001_38670 [Aeromonas dhakensis]